ncbi:MAG: hypothetical protein JWM74_1434 [Myxococcaceae bacterium]|nr:hypothetical protein [Myxococcaceae bacterium]
MALPLVPTALPTRLGGAVPLPGGKVHNRSGRDLYAVASRGGGTWEILRIVAGTTIGGDVIGEGPYLTRDVDWVTAVPPVADPGGGFAYDPTTIGVKIYDSGELTVLDRPGGGVRFDMTSGTLRSTIASVGQMNGGSRIVSR